MRVVTVGSANLMLRLINWWSWLRREDPGREVVHRYVEDVLLESLAEVVQLLAVVVEHRDQASEVRPVALDNLRGSQLA